MSSETRKDETAKTGITKPATELAKDSGAIDTEGAAPSDPAEVGGPKGPEPTRYGDWEKKGRCIDF